MHIPPEDIHACSGYGLPETTYLQYQDSYYQQIEGAAMGFQLPPIITNIYMEDYEKIAVDTLSLQSEFWCRPRYVDDTFVIWSHHQSTLAKFLHHLKGINPLTQFAMEGEQN